MPPDDRHRLEDDRAAAAAAAASLYHPGALPGQHAGGGHPPRFSSPSRPQKNDGVPKEVSSWGVATAASCILQSLVWAGLSVAAALVYRDVIPTADPPEASLGKNAKWDDFGTLLTYLYFKEAGVFPKLPDEGLLTPRDMYYFMGATLILSVILLITSSVMMRQVRLGGRGSARTSVVAWSVSMVAVTVLDVVLAAAMARDLVLVTSWKQSEADAFPGDVHALVLCPSAVLVVTLRGGIILVANVVCMIVLLRRASKMGKAASDRGARVISSTASSPSSTKREGPIDAFLYRNGDRNSQSFGTQNPVFIPDEAASPQPWAPSSFRPPMQEEQESRRGPGYHQGPGGRAPHNRVLQEDLDDVSHLSWMEEVDKHVDLRVRSVTRPSAPPHHRYGFIEQTETPVGNEAPPGYRSESMLPRVRVNPNAPKFPFIPPPDYSPPSAARSRALAALATGKGAYARPPHHHQVHHLYQQQQYGLPSSAYSRHTRSKRF